jgi:hypothetical protein
VAVFRTILKEPLLHFLVAGAALFVLFDAVSPDAPADLGENVIRVDRAALLTFIQYRSRAFKPDAAAARLDAMPEVERRRLIDDYVREAALHRKARALGMDANDYIIKRRMIQKVEFLAQGFADAAASPDEKSVKAYYEANKKDYYVQPSVTFTHVFFDAKKRGAEAAAASAKLERLNGDGVHFADAPRHGDRFPYHVNYVERTPDFVASHFGPAMARDVFKLKADDRVWRGPFRSPYGIHLVLVSKSLPGRIPTLEEVRTRVFDDARRAQARMRSKAAIDEIVSDYDVRIADDVEGGARLVPARATR